MATIIRQSYIDKIEKYLGKETIIVLVGQRRVGKSCMMKIIRDRKKTDDSNNIIFIDKEKREFEELSESIERLTKEKEELFNLFNSGEQIDDVATKASRFEEVKDLLDEMELRWLELSEKNS